jgi:hypothetical protein
LRFVEEKTDAFTQKPTLILPKEYEMREKRGVFASFDDFD